MGFSFPLRPFFVCIVAACPALLPGCGDDDSGQNQNNDGGTGLCGNGRLDDGEQCDEGPNNSDWVPDACRTDCRAAGCGDLVADTGESCDGTDLKLAICTDLGFSGGTLGCDSGCGLDTSECSVCGNGVIEDGEQCDGVFLGGNDCMSAAGHAEGTLDCDGYCAFDTSDCHTCGDGVLEGPESCDDGTANSDLLPDACRQDCTLPSCGDAVMDPGRDEECDGTDFGGATCSSLGLGNGTLDCSSGCLLVIAGCEGCGNGQCESVETPSNCPADCDVVGVSAGMRHSCAVGSLGGAWCWGQNNSGQLGDGTNTDRNGPVPVSTLTDALLVSAGQWHTCAVVAAGGTNAGRCWGSNIYGQLGNGSIASTNTPVAVSNLDGLVSIAAGGFHSCGVKSDGTVWCWGYNDNGQLGNGTNVQSETAVQVLGLNNALRVTCGLSHGCALLDTGQVRCWGDGAYGQVGDSTNDDRWSPVAVTGLNTAAAVSAGETHTCAVLADGTARCWGRNNLGQLGTGNTTDTNAPAAVLNLATGAMVACGSSHTCALLADGAARCWGYNTDGQLGDSTWTTSTSPVPVSSFGGGEGIGAGGLHSCAVVTFATVQCWGDGQFGQLGTGNNNDSNVPVTVQSL